MPLKVKEKVYETWLGESGIFTDSSVNQTQKNGVQFDARVSDPTSHMSEKVIKRSRTM